MKQTSARSIESAEKGMQVKSVPFAELPDQSRLFLEYLRRSASTKKYYPNLTNSPLAVGNFASEVLANYKTDRTQLCDALAEINRQLAASAKTFENIELLGDEDTVAVVTGQQAGIFTGPLYTIYKGLSAIKLADYLTQNGTKAVPVFWIATEDHDFDEVAQSWVLDKNGEPKRLRYQPAAMTEGTSVGEIKIDASITAFIDEFLSQMPVTEFSSNVRDKLRDAYCEGSGLGEAFGKIVATVFANYGLIAIDPLHERIKQLAAPIYEQAITRAGEIVLAVQNRNKELAADGFHSQVHVEEDYYPLFWHNEKGQRLALKKVSDGVYRVKGDKREFTTSDLLSLANCDPRKFSPGVMLRSVVQDYLLPTICYFGGSAEVAYFAQNSAAYAILERPVTPIFHRQSFSIVESRQRRTLEKFGLKFTDLFDGKEKSLTIGAERVLSPELADLFTEVEEEVTSALNRLAEQLASSDPTLATNLATRRRKISYHIATLRKKALMSEVKKDEALRRRIDGLFNSIVPNGDLQERTLNVFSFVNKHGFGIIDLLYDSVDLTDTGHRVIYL